MLCVQGAMLCVQGECCMFRMHVVLFIPELLIFTVMF